MDDPYSEEALQENARKRWREILHQKTFAERGEPLAKELYWVLNGSLDPDQHEKLLPDYCYAILELYRRTICKIFPTLAETVVCTDKSALASCKNISDAKPFLTLDWFKMGTTLGSLARMLRFIECEAEEKWEKDGLSDIGESEAIELCSLIIGDEWLQKKVNELLIKFPGKSIEEIGKEMWSKLVATSGSVTKWNEWAYQWSPDAMAKFAQGYAKGMTGFLNEEGELAEIGKIKLNESYVLLLIAWPEIHEMMNANPPKTRNDLWKWLEPFSYAGHIEIKDLEQLNRVCDSIGLRMKPPGPPRKIIT